jgi:hypothetical protein
MIILYEDAFKERKEIGLQLIRNFKEIKFKVV